jgi:hypothetical protein
MSEIKTVRDLLDSLEGLPENMPVQAFQGYRLHTFGVDAYVEDSQLLLELLL